MRTCCVGGPETRPVAKRIVAVLALQLLAAVAFGQSVEVRVDPRDLTLDDVAALQILLRDPPPRVLPPEVESDAFTVEAIPPAEGRFTGDGVFWRFLLVPIRGGAGKVRILLAVGNQRFEREETLRVREDSASPPKEPASRSAVAEDLTGRRFVRAEVDKRRVYVHEQVTYRFRYYFENWLPTASAPQYALPAFRGFFSKTLDPSSTPASGKVSVGNREYYVEEVRVALFPLTEGVWSIPPTRLVLPAVGSRGKSRELLTESLQVTALPLPTPPTGFSGGVGQFTTRLETPDSEARVGESVRLRVVVEGRGNVETLTNVPRPEVAGAQLFEPTISDTVVVVKGTVEGSRVYEYVLTPERAGTLTVRMPSVVTFDPKTARYVSSEPETLSLPVRQVSTPVDRNEARPSASWRRRAQTLVLWLLVVGVVAAVWRVGSRSRARPADVPRRTEPPRESVDDIPTGDGRAFCRRLGETLRRTARERYGMPLDAPLSDVLARLDGHGSPEASALASLIRECEVGEFAPVVLSLAEQESLRDRASTALRAFRRRD
jgi:hypothetical protein